MVSQATQPQNEPNGKHLCPEGHSPPHAGASETTQSAVAAGKHPQSPPLTCLQTWPVGQLPPQADAAEMVQV